MGSTLGKLCSVHVTTLLSCLQAEDEEDPGAAIPAELLDAAGRARVERGEGIQEGQVISYEAVPRLGMLW